MDFFRSGDVPPTSTAIATGHRIVAQSADGGLSWAICACRLRLPGPGMAAHLRSFAQPSQEPAAGPLRPALPAADAR
jgi:hypothetical protein